MSCCKKLRLFSRLGTSSDSLNAWPFPLWMTWPYMAWFLNLRLGVCPDRLHTKIKLDWSAKNRTIVFWCIYRTGQSHIKRYKVLKTLTLVPDWMFEEKMQEAQKLYKQNMGFVFSNWVPHSILWIFSFFFTSFPYKRCVFFLAFRLLSGPAKPLGPSATLTTTPPSCRAQVDQNGLGFFCQKKHGMKSESMGVPEHQNFELVILRQTMFDYWRHLKANS